MLDLEGQEETFVWECIEKMIPNKPYFTLKGYLKTVKEKILSE